VQVLRSRVVSSVELALQPDRDAGHIPGGDAPHNQVGRRVSERGTVEALLDAVTIAIEPDRVKVNPPAGTTGHLQAHGKPVGLFGEPHRLERSTSHPKRVSVDRQVEVAVLAGRFTVERVDSPASGGRAVTEPTCRKSSAGATTDLACSRLMRTSEVLQILDALERVAVRYWHLSS